MVKIVRATLEDVPGLVPLFGGYRQFYRAEPDASAQQKFLEDRLSKEESVIFIAQDESGTAIGFTQLYPSFSSVTMAPIWILNDLFVDSSTRGTGAGRALLERARDWAIETGAVRLQLATEVTNEHAQAVYKACGWERNTTFYHYSLSVQ
jgi:GNAT superfamily N-acetyltransferase